jgi:hypothetical protein
MEAICNTPFDQSIHVNGSLRGFAAAARAFGEESK